LLKANLVGNNLVISWPTNATGFVLQSTASLAPPNWTNVTNSVVVAGPDNTVTQSLSGFSRYFRLRR
jgi:hypothetical protein